MEDVNHLLGHGTEDTYLFTVHSSRRNLSVHPDPNEYVIKFDTPFRNVVALDVVQALIPRSQYIVDTHNHKLVLFIAETRYEIFVPVGEYTHDSLRDALNVQLNPLGVTAAFQDRGRNVFELFSDRVLKLDVLNSSMTRLLGFNTNAEYPELEFDRVHGMNVETNRVKHAWNLYPDSPPWPDLVTSDATKTIAAETNGVYASTLNSLALSQESVSFSYRYTHNVYTSQSFRYPRWTLLCQTPNGYDIDASYGTLRVRRYTSFDLQRARNAIVLPMTPDEPSIPSTNHISFSFPSATMDVSNTYALVPRGGAYLGEESMVRDVASVGEGGLAIWHAHSPGWYDVNRIDTNEPVFVTHVNSDTKLVDQQLYMVTTFRYRDTRGYVSMFRYGAHPDDETREGYIEVGLNDGALVVDRYVEEFGSRSTTLDLVASIHDTSGDGGFVEPQIEGGTRYRSTLSNEYTFTTYLKTVDWESVDVNVESFHRIVWLGKTWTCKINGPGTALTSDPTRVAVQVSVYDVGRSMTDLATQYYRDLGDRGIARVKGNASFDTLLQSGALEWMVVFWTLVFAGDSDTSASDSLSAQLRTVIIDGIADFLTRLGLGNSIDSTEWETWKQNVQSLLEITSARETVPEWSDELEIWNEIAQNAIDSGGAMTTADAQNLATSLYRLGTYMGLFYDVGSEEYGIPGGGSLLITHTPDDNASHTLSVLPFVSPTTTSTLELPISSFSNPPAFLESLAIDSIPCLGIVIDTPSEPTEKTVFSTEFTLSYTLPTFQSNTSIAFDSFWDSNTWTVDASSANEYAYLALNTTNLSPSDGWRSNPSTSPARYQQGNHSPLLYWKSPLETLVSDIHSAIETDAPDYATLQTVYPSTDSFNPYTSLGSRWDTGLGGTNGILVRGDSRTPALFACRIEIPSTADVLYNRVIFSIGSETVSLAIGFDANGHLFGRVGTGNSNNPETTSVITFDPKTIDSFLGEEGWLSWFVIPSTFGTQLGIYWNGVRLGQSTRTSSSVTKWSDSKTGGYLTFFGDQSISPWASQTPHWIRVHNSQRPMRILRYEIESINENREAEYTYPTAFHLQGSNDNVSWKTLDQRNVTEWPAQTIKEFEVADEGTYWYVRLLITGSTRSFVSIGRWNMSVVPIQSTTDDYYQVPVILFGLGTLGTFDALPEGRNEQIPTVRLDWGGISYQGFILEEEPISETGVAIQSKVYVYQNQTPSEWIRARSPTSTIRIRTSPTLQDGLTDIDIEGRITDVIQDQGTHPTTGLVTDAIEWFARSDTLSAAFQRYAENELVGRGELSIRETFQSRRSSRLVLHPNLAEDQVYTLTVRLFPDGLLRYVVLGADDTTENRSRYYTVDPVPVMGLLDDTKTGRMTGFENASLTFPQTNADVHTNDFVCTLRDLLWAFGDSDASDVFPTYQEYSVEQVTNNGGINTYTVRVVDDSFNDDISLPSSAFHTFHSGHSTWGWELALEGQTRYKFVRACLDGQGLDALFPESGPMVSITVQGEDGNSKAFTLDSIDPQRAYLTFSNPLDGDVRIEMEGLSEPDFFRIWKWSLIAYDSSDERTCYEEFEPITLPQQVRNAVLCHEDGTVRVLNGDENTVSSLSSTSPPTSGISRDHLRVALPKSDPIEVLYRLERLEIAEPSYANETFLDSFRYLEKTVYAYSTPIRQGGSFERSLFPASTGSLVTTDAFRWIQYFTVGDIDSADISLHSFTMFLPDDQIFDRTIPMTFTLCDEESRVLDEFTTFWDGETDSEGRIVAIRYGTDRIGPFTNLTSLDIAYDKFRTAKDIRLKKGVRYSLLVSTLEVLVKGQTESISDMDKAFSLRVAYVPGSDDTLKGFVATYSNEQRVPEWVEGFVPLRIRLSNIEHRITSPGITTLSPDSFIKLSIPEIESHVFFHRNYDQWTGGIATFFLSPGLEHKEFHEHMHVGLVKRFFPIGRLDQMTIRFLNEDNTPYNFRGVNHVLRLVLHYLVPKWNPYTESILAPHYDPSRYGLYKKESEAESSSIVPHERGFVTGAVVAPKQTPTPTTNESIFNVPTTYENQEKLVQALQEYATVIQESGSLIENIREEEGRTGSSYTPPSKT